MADVETAHLIRRIVNVIKCISVPRDDSSHQRIVIHNVCVATKFYYTSK